MESSLWLLLTSNSIWSKSVTSNYALYTVPVKQGLIRYRDCGVITVFAHIHALLS